MQALHYSTGGWIDLVVQRETIVANSGTHKSADSRFSEGNLRLMHASRQVLSASRPERPGTLSFQA